MVARPVILVLCLVVVVLSGAVQPAAAQTGGYVQQAWSGCAGGFNSGGFDDAGRTYVPCGQPTTIGIYSPEGNLVEQVELDVTATDVAPTPDGAHIYVATSGAPLRLSRNGAGTWARDSWSPAPYSMDGSAKPAGGLFVAADAAGNAYFADGAWAPNQVHTVVKYDPQGQVVTRFGSYSRSWQIGTFYWMLTGLAVTRDGTTVHTAEVGNNRVQTWRQGSTGSYSVLGSFGGTEQNNADRGGYCDYTGWRGAFAAPYDVALDGAGNVYVLNTTCKQVLRFTPGFGQMTANLDVRVAGGDYPRPHGFAVGRDGTVFVGENSTVLVPAPGRSVAAPPARAQAPAPSTVAPAPPAPPAPAVPPAEQPPATPVNGDEEQRPTPLAGAPNLPVSLILRIGPHALSGPVRRRVLTVAAACSRACTARIEIRTRGRLIGLATRTLRGGRPVAVPVRLGMRRSPGRTSVTIRMVGRTAPAAPIVRVVTLRR